MTDQAKLNSPLKVPIFHMQPFLSEEQSKLEARQAADANYMQYDAERAKDKIDNAQV